MKKDRQSRARFVCMGCGAADDLHERKIGSMTYLVFGRCLDLIDQGAKQYSDTRPDNMEGVPKQ